MKVRSWWLAVIVLVGLAAWMGSGYLTRGDARSQTAAAARSAERDEPVMAVQVREQRAEAVTRRLELQGQSLPDRQVTVRAEIDARVQAVPVDRGSRVEEGATLVELAMNDRSARLEEARALVRQRQAETEAARKLGSSGYQSSTEVQGAEAALAAARARLVSIREEIADTEIAAPFAGVLETRNVEVGDYLAPGDAVASVVDLDPLRVEVNVSQGDVASVEAGGRAQVHFATGEKREATVSYIAATAAPETRTFRVELEVANPQAAIPAGVSATVRIPIETVRAHFLSPAVLSLSDDGKLGAKTVNGDGRVVFHAVSVVRAELDGVWVTGLPETARLITVGQGFVRAGEPVRAVSAADSDLDLNRSASPKPMVSERG